MSLQYFEEKKSFYQNVFSSFHEKKKIGSKIILIGANMI